VVLEDLAGLVHKDGQDHKDGLVVQGHKDGLVMLVQQALLDQVVLQDHQVKEVNKVTKDHQAHEEKLAQ